MPESIGRQVAVGAAIIGFVVAGLLVIALIQFVGWLAIGLIGLVVLLVSYRLDILGGHAVTDVQQGVDTVELLAKQMAQKDAASPSDKLAAAAESESRVRMHYIARTVGLALTAAGFGMFLLHQV